MCPVWTSGMDSADFCKKSGKRAGQRPMTGTVYVMLFRVKLLAIDCFAQIFEDQFPKLRT